MLQPSSSPQHLPSFSGSEQQPSSNVAPPQREAGPSSPSLWQWLSTRELVFVFIVCSLGVLLFRTKDEFQFVPVWKELVELSHFENSKFPLDDEKL